jgi:hypothetical protein
MFDGSKRLTQGIAECSIRTVFGFTQLAAATRHDADFREDLLVVLHLAGEVWDAACDHADLAVGVLACLPGVHVLPSQDAAPRVCEHVHV